MQRLRTVSLAAAGATALTAGTASAANAIPHFAPGLWAGTAVSFTRVTPKGRKAQVHTMHIKMCVRVNRNGTVNSKVSRFKGSTTFHFVSTKNGHRYPYTVSVTNHGAGARVEL